MMNSYYEERSIYEFVRNLWENAYDPSEQMTIETAAEDLNSFHKEGWDIPDGITAEEYAELWNKFVAEAEEE